MTAHDDNMAVYSSGDFHVLRRVKLDNVVVSLDIVKVQTVETATMDNTALLLPLSTALEAFLYTILCWKMVLRLAQVT